MKLACKEYAHFTFWWILPNNPSLLETLWLLLKYFSNTPLVVNTKCAVLRRFFIICILRTSLIAFSSLTSAPCSHYNALSASPNIITSVFAHLLIKPVLHPQYYVNLTINIQLHVSFPQVLIYPVLNLTFDKIPLFYILTAFCTSNIASSCTTIFC